MRSCLRACCSLVQLSRISSLSPCINLIIDLDKSLLISWKSLSSLPNGFVGLMLLLGLSSEARVVGGGTQPALRRQRSDEVESARLKSMQPAPPTDDSATLRR